MPRPKATIPAWDIGLMRGFAVFDYTRTYGMVPFMLREHAARLRTSARAIGLKCPYSLEQLCRWAESLVRKEGLPDRGLRMILTGGDAAGLSPAATAKPRLVMLTEPIAPLDPDLIEKGGRLLVHPVQRDLPAAKTTGYLHAVRLNEERLRQKACDILYVVDGKVRECSISNFFLVKKGKVITPKDDILPGITRTVALRLARKLFGPGNVVERDVFATELATADEAFVTATNKFVPIVRVGGTTIGLGLPGEVTTRLMGAYADFVADYVATQKKK